MERPTCRTCPYWNKFVRESDGDCHRYPPSPASNRTQQRLTEEVDGYTFEGWFVVTDEADWCGEHPLFPEYLRSLKAPASRSGDPSDDRINFETWTLRAVKVIMNMGIKTWSQLADVTESELSASHGCGPLTLSEVVAKLEARGLRFRRDEEPAQCVTARQSPA